MSLTLQQQVLLADIGGTNARFALLQDGIIVNEARFRVADHAGALEAVRAFLEPLGEATRPCLAALAFAGPIEAETARLTNGAWRVSAAELRAAFGLEAVRLVNDFAAIAWALPKLAEVDLAIVGGGRPVEGAPLAVIGPGTGLGVAGFIPGSPRPTVLTTEGGHVTMAPADTRESAILDHLRDRFGHVSAERVLSGEGLENLYRAAAAVDGIAVPTRRDAEILERALAGDCPASAAALDCFCDMLGTVAGNLALTLGALGGVYIAGGIVPRFVEHLAASRFRERFEAKGRFRPYLARIPTYVVVHPEPAFLGLMNLLEQEIDGPAKPLRDPS